MGGLVEGPSVASCRAPGSRPFDAFRRGTSQGLKERSLL
ncbi:hypothetical protein CORC01_02012 [Colletotrichum orchidophilum]|uniref:Uncharacterized protein n=1 Tax=Colletotrichum orchidophilum TaxID=1209926 RepID=A0A1G4BMT7_9PEZI|nr:uncharacterized protein CORC01_02012 [Colletotrichum orchidophilum]OHF02616.1 hypothetical protein CORC01_02012 [Colletotrichum orchidophilum]